MWKKVGLFFFYLLALVTTAFLAWVAWVVIANALQLLRQLDSGVSSAIIAAFVAVIGGFYSLRQTRLREIEESHRDQKVKLYETYMDLIGTIFSLSRQNKLSEISDGTVPPDIEVLYLRLQRGLIIWGSPGVIKAYSQFLQLSRNGASPKNILRGADTVFQAMRKDLRNSNWGLQQGDLMKLFLKDPEEYDRMS